MKQVYLVCVETVYHDDQDLHIEIFDNPEKQDQYFNELVEDVKKMIV